jgi:hypothetical protein
MMTGPHMLSFFRYPEPFVDNPEQQVDWLPHPSHRQAWITHCACFGVDYFNHGASVELGYVVLSKLVAETLDGNCTGVYIPQPSSLIPNDESLCLELQKIASARESGVNVTP